MSSLYTHQASNIRKTWILMILFLVVVGVIGYFVSIYYGSPIIFYIAVVFSLFMNIGSFWYSDKIALSVTHAKPAKKEEFYDLYTVTENLSITAGLPMPKLFVINDSTPNAFATGRDKEHATIAVTTGLLQSLERSELEGVIAHELSHIGNRDILIMTAVVVLVGFVAIISDIFLRSLWFGGGSRDNRGGSGNYLMIIGLVLVVLSPIIATLIKLAVSRKREFLADASGALLTRYPEGLASALLKISKNPNEVKHTSNATAHLFIASPFGSKAKKGLHRLFATHPPVQDRIKALQGIKI